MKKYKHVLQQESWDCVAAVAATITDTTLADFIEFCGHDGSAYDEKSKHPDKKRAFCMYELAGYLAKHKFHFGCHLNKDYSIPDVFKGCIAILLVKSQTLPAPIKHVVILAENEVLDPQHEEAKKLEDYDITEVWPVIKWELTDLRDKG